VIPVADERLKRVLCYPRFSEEFYRRVVGDLRAMGIEGVISEGRVEIDGLRVLGKGCVGIVLLGMLKGERIALKVLRADANRATLKEEARLLAMANEAGVGPKLIAAEETAIAMEYIDGKYLSKWLQEPHALEEVKYVVRELLRQCRRLDEAGLDHGELSNAKKHALVDVKGKPKILDFETASTNRKCRNFVSMLSYLFFKGSMLTLVGRYMCWEGSAVRDLIRQYKEAPSEEVRDKIMRELSLE